MCFGFTCFGCWLVLIHFGRMPIILLCVSCFRRLFVHSFLRFCVTHHFCTLLLNAPLRSHPYSVPMPVSFLHFSLDGCIIVFVSSSGLVDLSYYSALLSYCRSLYRLILVPWSVISSYELAFPPTTFAGLVQDSITCSSNETYQARHSRTK